MIKIPTPHFEIKITQRSKGQSAVAGAAYQSGEKLFSEYDQKNKDYRRKENVIYTKIMLPSNAPPEYTDRETLWNSVEAVETQWNSQLARRFVLALPREVPDELYPQMVEEYCEKHFVSKGMVVDFAIHDPNPPKHNPHCHIMLTLRAMDEHGNWLPKAKKVYDLDENGERIRLPSGRWKSHKESTVDWNEQFHCQEWRDGWEQIQNRYLEMVNSPARVNLHSYKKQGLDIIPTVHMGVAATQMERRGIKTNIGNLNRDIRATNRMMAIIRNTIQNLSEWLNSIIEIAEELKTDNENSSPDLMNLMQDYLNLRKEERLNWSRYSQQKGTKNDLQAFINATNYLRGHQIFTLERLDTVLDEAKQKYNSVSSDMRKAEHRIKVIVGIQSAVADCQQYKAIHDKYVKIGWKTVKSAYYEKHKDELNTYNKAYRFLKKQGVDLNVDLETLKSEHKELQISHEKRTKQLAEVESELKPLKEIRYWVSKVLAQEHKEVEQKPEPKHSITEQLKEYQKEAKQKQKSIVKENEQNMAH